MRCRVKNCESDNYRLASSCSFFTFPCDKKLLKMWVKFCRQEESFNTKTSFICMKHFTSDDFVNKMQYEMGFAKNRILKRGAVPTIYNPLSGNQVLAAKRSKRIERRDNKKIVHLLLQQRNVDPVTLHEENNENDSAIIDARLEELTKPTAENVEEQTPQLEDGALNRYFMEEIVRLRKEVESLRTENSCLRNTQKRHISEIAALKQSAIDAKRKHEFNINIVETRLLQAEYEIKNVEEKLLNIFTKDQISKLKIK